MTYQDYKEEQDITFTVGAIDNNTGEVIATITGASYEDIAEQWRKLDRAVNDNIKEQYDALPDAPEWIEELLA